MVSESRRGSEQNTSARTGGQRPAESPDEFIFRLIKQTADVRGCEIMDLPPLAHAIDPEAVASIALDGNTTITFGFADCTVFAGEHGALMVSREE